MNKQKAPQGRNKEKDLVRATRVVTPCHVPLSLPHGAYFFM